MTFQKELSKCFTMPNKYTAVSKKKSLKKLAEGSVNCTQSPLKKVSSKKLLFTLLYTVGEIQICVSSKSSCNTV